MGLYFITTNHLETKIWFRDNEDFKVGMNYVAVLAATMCVSVIAFILMSNHVHFLLRCTDTDAQLFIDSFKKLYSMHYRAKYGETGLLRRNTVDIQRISLKDEGAERVIAYIIMNSVAAKICLTASGYRWGSGPCYFNENKEKGVRIGSLSIRKQRMILKTHTAVNQDWLLSADGYILPDSYVKVEEIERLFKTPTRMQYFLNSSGKARRAMEKEGPAFDDQLLVSGVRSLCVSLFGKKNLSDLSKNELTEILRQIRWRFGSDVHQISRISGIPYEDVTEFINAPDIQY